MKKYIFINPDYEDELKKFEHKSLIKRIFFILIILISVLPGILNSVVFK